MGMPKGKEKEKETEKNISRNNGWSQISWKKLHIQEVQQTSRKINLKRSTPAHTLIRLLQD